MKLIKELGSRTMISESGKRNTRKWGLFECPSCHIRKEYNLQKGNKNKTCGAAGCRKTIAQFNPWNANVAEEDKLKNSPYYSSFATYYKTLVNKYQVCAKWCTLQGFREDMYNSFKKQRDLGSQRLTLHMADNKELSNLNCKWSSVMSTKIYATEDKINGYYHTLLLASELLMPQEDIDKIIGYKYPNKVKEIIWGSQGNTVASPNIGFKLSTQEYLNIRNEVRNAQQIKLHYSVYAIRMKDTDYVKIGRTTNIANRLDDLNVGNPYELEVLFEEPSYNLGKIEQRVHKFLYKYKVKGEWFLLKDTEIEEAKQFLISIVENP